MTSKTVSENLHSMFSHLEDFITAKTVVGDPVTFGDVILVPLVEVSFGAGGGLGEKAKTDAPDRKAAGGAGLGAKITPVAVVVIANGNVQLVNVKNQESVNKLIDMIPGVLSKFNLDKFFAKKEAAPGECTCGCGKNPCDCAPGTCCE